MKTKSRNSRFRPENRQSLPGLRGTFFAVLCLALVGCGSTGIVYDGEEFEWTGKIDVFYAETEVPREYRVIGEGVLEIESTAEPGHVRHRFIREAQRRGAHAVVIRDAVAGSPWQSSAATPAQLREVTGLFLRYEPPKPEDWIPEEPVFRPRDFVMENQAEAEDSEPARKRQGEKEDVEEEPEIGEKIDLKENAVFTGDVEKLEELGLPKPRQKVMED